jgi:FkbM family methyltransferase
MLSISKLPLSRLRRFLSRPWHEKIDSIRGRWDKVLSWVPKPVRLPFGRYFFVRDDELGTNLRNFETGELNFVQRFLRPGMTVLDIGAHQGLYTLLASACVARDGRVFAFEPSRRERRSLWLNLRLNRCRNVSVQPLALGNDRGSFDFYVVQGQYTGCNSLRPPASELGTTKLTTVSLERLDDWAKQSHVKRVDFIKLDVEGAELSVLKGGSGILVHQRPVLLVEVAPIRSAAWGYDAAEIVRLLEATGYGWFAILDGGRLRQVSQIHEREMNIVAIPSERQDLLEGLVQA